MCHNFDFYKLVSRIIVCMWQTQYMEIAELLWLFWFQLVRFLENEPHEDRAKLPFTGILSISSNKMPKSVHCHDTNAAIGAISDIRFSIVITLGFRSTSNFN